MEIAQAHLQWIRNHPNFIPSEGNTIDNTTTGGGRIIPHYDTMTLVYSNPNSYQLAEGWFRDDVRHFNTVQQRMRQCEYDFSRDAPKCYFLTVNFANQTTVDQARQIADRILTYEWCIKLQGVLEFNTAEGYHPHFHAVIYTNVTRSKLIEKVFAVKDLKKYCSKKNFIDAKEGLPYHLEYVKGIKTDTKEAYILADRELRDKHNIPHLYQK